MMPQRFGNYITQCFALDRSKLVVPREGVLLGAPSLMYSHYTIREALSLLSTTA